MPMSMQTNGSMPNCPNSSELTSFTIESERLGLKGKLDCVKRDGSGWVPFEVKKGHSAGRQGEGVWPSDELQLTAYAMLLEELLGAPVLEGQIHLLR